MTNINAIYTGTSKLNAATRHDLIRQTKSSFMVAEEVLDFYYKNTAMQLISSTDAKGIIKLFKEYGSYRLISCYIFPLDYILVFEQSLANKFLYSQIGTRPIVNLAQKGWIVPKSLRVLLYSIQYVV